MTQNRTDTQLISKMLLKLKENPELFREKEINFILGLTTTQIKDLKKIAINDGFIIEHKREYFLTEFGEQYLSENPFVPSKINLEYLKLEKAPPTLNRAIRLLAKHLIEGEDLKENSTEHYLVRELLCSKSNCAGLKKEIEDFVLQDKKQKITSIFEHFSSTPYRLTKSIISVLLLDVLVKNKDILAIYEQGQFQLTLTQLMFDRMIYCPQNFELQKTVLDDMPILEDISAIILPCKSKNILDLTKGLIHFIRNLDKYTFSTERLNKSTARFRNSILNAKDPISLFYRDIPKILNDTILCQCSDKFVKTFDETICELQNSYTNLIKELNKFLLDSFEETDRTKLAGRFQAAKEFLGDSDLKILSNNIAQVGCTENLWTERIATFVNKSRVPKDWSDKDVADFKVKVKELAMKFITIENTVGTEEVKLDEKLSGFLNELLKLSKPQQMTILRKVVNG